MRGWPEARATGCPGRADSLCQRPWYFPCERCGGFVIGNCNTTRRAKCHECALRYQRRVQLICRSGAVDRVTERVAFLTFSAGIGQHLNRRDWVGVPVHIERVVSIRQRGTVQRD